MRVRIWKADTEEEKQTSPQFEPLSKYPGMGRVRKTLMFFAGKGKFK